MSQTLSSNDVPAASNNSPDGAEQILKVAILGAPTSSGNRGVLALASGLVNLLGRGPAKLQATMLVGSPTATPLKTVLGGRRIEVPAINYRLTYRSGLATCLPWIFAMSLLYRLVPLRPWRSLLERKIPWIGCLAEADIVGDVRGGDSFSDIYGLQRYLWGFVCVLTAFLVHGPIVQFPQTYGPYKTRTARSIARYILRRSRYIIARDKKSQRVARELTRPSQSIRLSPDVAFALEVVDPAIESTPSKPVIGINVNGLMFNGGYDRSNMFGLKLDYPQYLHSLINQLLENGDEEIWLVPHTYAPPGNVESDNEACSQVRDAFPNLLKERIHVITEEYDQHEIKGIIGKCDAFVGSRMHSCIGALSQGIPCVGLAYSMKFSGVFESVGMGDWVIEATDQTTESAVDKTLNLIATRDQRRENLKLRSETARSELERAFSELTQAAALKKQ